MKFPNKTNIVFAILFVLITVVIVKASTLYTVAVEEEDISSFPQVQLSLKITGDTSNLFARHFHVSENGERNNGPIVILPPDSSNNKIDLFILLDQSGNTENYQSIIRSNLKSLILYMENQGVDLKVNITAFSSSDTPQDETPESYTEFANLETSIDSMAFDSSHPKRVYGLNKIYNFASTSSRSGAEKVALIINGSQFYDQDRGEDTTYNVRETINELAANDFITFVVGAPIKQLHSLRSDNTEDASLSHSMAGGYLGSFGTDLTVIHDLLQKRGSNRFVLQYYSTLPLSEASSGSAQIYIKDYPVKTINYPDVDVAEPMMTHDVAHEALLGDPFPVRIEIAPYGKLVNVVEMFYLNAAGGVQNQVLIHKRDESTDDLLVFEGAIPGDDYPEDYLRYYVSAHTAYHTIGSEADTVSVPVFAYDTGIFLQSQIINDEEILWTWYGETVDQGIQYELWAGDSLIINTTERNYSIPITECNKYQVVKVRVLLKPDADHPHAGDWSLFSRPGERFAGEETTITEQEGIEKMIECLDDKTATSLSSFVQNEPNYEALKNLYLEKMFYYFTRVIDPSIGQDVEFGRYRLLYYLMNFINYTEYSTYSTSSDDILNSIVYKAITNANQTNNITQTFETAIQELIIRMRGSLSF
ncbi:VWA domain-containing protein [Patescibacteria group bacterium]|nr:VWA domain-containing protein [Patescibacteria group bacterium]MBU1682786.1 VWA domain-containing protein [Patescibacteria group bacterium]MBU1935376.1 VWA domain-containing protein [Patescibacteria group bacterium]